MELVHKGQNGKAVQGRRYRLVRAIAETGKVFVVKCVLDISVDQMHHIEAVRDALSVCRCQYASCQWIFGLSSYSQLLQAVEKPPLSNNKSVRYSIHNDTKVRCLSNVMHTIGPNRVCALPRYNFHWKSKDLLSVIVPITKSLNILRWVHFLCAEARH